MVLARLAGPRAAAALATCLLALLSGLPGASASPPTPWSAWGRPTVPAGASARADARQGSQALLRPRAVRRRRSWPAGVVAGGGHVTWSAERTSHTSFRQARRWWGAASTRIRIHRHSARHVYAFRMRLPRHVSLSLSHFGEVVATRHGRRVGMLGRPWATDSRGHHKHTWYTVHGRVVKQHVAFGRRASFPITADPWWNPVTWHWDTVFSVAWREVRSCGRGAVHALVDIGGATGTTNVLLKHVAGRAALMVPGGEYTYAGFAVWGCIGSFF
jgi:hypothetical protein